jgi:hypothetical protein
VGGRAEMWAGVQAYRVSGLGGGLWAGAGEHMCVCACTGVRVGMSMGGRGFMRARQLWGSDEWACGQVGNHADRQLEP